MRGLPVSQVKSAKANGSGFFTRGADHSGTGAPAGAGARRIRRGRGIVPDLSVRRPDAEQQDQQHKQRENRHRHSEPVAAPRHREKVHVRATSGAFQQLDFEQFLDRRVDLIELLGM